MAGENRKMVGIKAGELVAVDIESALSQTRAFDHELCNLAITLSI